MKTLQQHGENLCDAEANLCFSQKNKMFQNVNPGGKMAI